MRPARRPGVHVTACCRMTTPADLCFRTPGSLGHSVRQAGRRPGSVTYPSVNYSAMNGRVCRSTPPLAAEWCCVRAVDCAPALDAALGNGEGRIVIGVSNDPARPTAEGLLVRPVPPVAVPAAVAGLRG